MEGTQNMLENLYSKLEQFLRTETVVGEPITVGAVTLIPIITASFGMGGGLGEETKDKGKNSGGGAGGGIGCRIVPSGILVIKGEDVELISLEGKGSLDKLFEMVPELIATLKGMKEAPQEEKAGEDAGGEDPAEEAETEEE